MHGPGSDEPLVWYEGSGTTDRRWLIADERGSVIASTDASGAASAIRSYDEYGIPSGGNVGRFGYTGQAWLPELGMAYYKARMYSPTLGRFLQTDPIGYGDGMNIYAYVRNDPINLTDPLGLDGVAEAAKCGLPDVECPPPGQDGPDIPVEARKIVAAVPDPAQQSGDIVVIGSPSRSKPQKSEPKKGCLGVAWAKNRQAIIGDGVGLAASALPGGRPAVALAGLAIGAGVLTNTAMTGNQQRPGLTIASLSLGIAGIHITSAGPLAEAYKATSTLAKNLPGIGAVVAGGALILDAANVYQDYQACQNN